MLRADADGRTGQLLVVRKIATRANCEKAPTVRPFQFAVSVRRKTALAKRSLRKNGEA